MAETGRADVSISDLIVRPHHTAFSCEDWDLSMAFFVDVLGFRILGQMDDRSEPELATVVGMPGAKCRWAMLELGGHHIELFKWLTPTGKPHGNHQADIGYTHICLQVSDVWEVHKRLTAAGWQPLSEPQPLRGGAALPMYVAGPEGCIIEFVEYTG